MSDPDFTTLLADLERDGFAVARGLLPPALIRHLQTESDHILPTIASEHRARNRSQGSLVQLADHPAFAPLIGSAELRAAFAGMGFRDPRFTSGYLISKPPKSPALFWHQDWWGWDDPISYTGAIAQFFVMVYLTETSPANGCLRVIPGSHRRRHPLHRAIQAHDESLSRVTDPGHPLFQMHPDAVPVPVRPGDVVFGDARLIHSAFPNDSGADRSLLTLWYHPDLAALPAAMRATIRNVFERREVDTDPAAAGATTVDDWPEEARRLVADLAPPKVTGVAPHPWNRVPNFPEESAN
ncbi:MAG: phytanoyl-CoA dioxygenase family protein [Alphaproteobacteria bacterium]